MVSKVWSSATLGIDALPVEIETHIVPGVPKYTVVGLAAGAVRESLDRIFAAARNTGLFFLRGKTTINLAPADVRKESASFDLPMAMGLLAVSDGSFSPDRLDGFFITGELALDGHVRPVRGVLSMAMRARAEGKHSVLVPAANAAEAAVVEGVAVYPIKTLEEACHVLAGRRAAPPPYVQDFKTLFDEARHYEIDFADVRGQENVKRALEVAVAEGHNALMGGCRGRARRCWLAASPPSCRR